MKKQFEEPEVMTYSREELVVDTGFTIVKVYVG